MFPTFMRMCQNVPSALDVSVLCEIVKVTHCRSVAISDVSAAKGNGPIPQRVTKDTFGFIASVTLFISSPSSKEMQVYQSDYIHTNKQMAIQEQVVVNKSFN